MKCCNYRLEVSLMWHGLEVWLGTVVSSRSLDVPLVGLHVGVVLLVNIWAFI